MSFKQKNKEVQFSFSVKVFHNFIVIFAVIMKYENDDVSVYCQKLFYCSL